MNATITELSKLERKANAYGLQRVLVIALLISIAGTAIVILALSGTFSLLPAQFLKDGAGHSPVWELLILAGAVLTLLVYWPISGWRLNRLDEAIVLAHTRD